MQLTSYCLFVFVLIFSPLAFATVEPWAMWIVECLVLSSFLLLFVSRYRKNQSFFQIPGTLPLFLFLGWIAIQMLPMPVSFLKIFSPVTFDIYSPLLDADSSIGWLPLTLNPKATLHSFFKWAAFALFYILTIYHLKDAKRLKQLVIIVAIFCSALAIEAILQKLTSPDAIYWFRPGPSGSTPVGPWVYSNQYAGFMEMVFPVIVALFLFYRPKVHYEKKLKDRTLAMLTMPGANHYLLLGSGAILIAVSILLSLSRGGIITLCIAFLFFTFLSARITPSHQVRWGIVLSICVVLMITWFGWQPIMNEFGSFWGKDGLDSSMRLPLFQDTLNIFMSFPLFGSGIGTFQYVFPAFRTIPGETVFDHVHNDYLELLAEGGLVGFLLCACFLATVIKSATRTLFKRRENYSILIACGALTGILALLLHCFVDFQFANGANALYFFFFLGLAISAANTRIQYRTRSTFLSRKRGTGRPFIIMIVFGLLISSFWYHLGQHRAKQTIASIQPIFLNPYIPPSRLQEIHTIFSQATHLDPLESDYRLRTGYVSTFLKNLEQAREEYLQACRLNPLSGSSLQQLGLAMPGGDTCLREKFISLGLEREPLAYERYLTYSTWLLNNNRPEDAFAVLQQACARIPERAPDIARFIVRNRFHEKEIEQILPDKAYAWHELAKIMESLHRLIEAEQYYMKALDYLDIRDVNPDYFRRPYSLLSRTRKEEKALNILRMAIQYLPDNTWFRIQLGDYYVREGIPYRAREEYLQALRIDPDNRALRRKIEEISEISL